MAEREALTVVVEALEPEECRKTGIRPFCWSSHERELEQGERGRKDGQGIAHGITLGQWYSLLPRTPTCRFWFSLYRRVEPEAVNRALDGKIVG